MSSPLYAVVLANVRVLKLNLLGMSAVCGMAFQYDNYITLGPDELCISSRRWFMGQYVTGFVFVFLSIY